MNFKLMGAVAALTMMAAGAHAATVNYMAMLDGKSETPANTEKGSGLVEGKLDTATKVFTYTVTYKDLTGPATAAHFHKGAMGAAGPPVVPVPQPLASPIKGTATLTDAQIADLNAGKVYFNVHTAANPGGEIRGTLAK